MSNPQLHFLFPSHPLRPAQVEPMFADQFDAFRTAAFPVSVFAESVIENSKPLRNMTPDATVVYRGWMLKGPEYCRLADAITAAGASSITPPRQYLAAHHLPNWYPLLAEFTAETRTFPPLADFEAELRQLGWDGYFVKDFVKSLKTSRGSIVRDPSEIGPLVEEMKKFRGDIEGGLCLRCVERYLPGSERRFFVIGGRAFAPHGIPVPEIVEKIVDRIDLQFYSVDIAIREHGTPRLIEIGDGQVSDPVGWTAEEFAAIWQ